MGLTESIRAAAADWMTAAEIADIVGSRSQNVRALLVSRSAGGLFERRFSDGRGTEYRAIPGAEPRRPRTSIPMLLEALADGPKTVRQVAGEGADKDLRDAWLNAAYRAEARGLVERAAPGRPVVWRLKQ